MRPYALAALLAVVLAGTTTACTAGPPAAPDRLVIAAGDTEDVYRVLGEAFAEAVRRDWSAHVDVISTDGAVENLQRVAEGTADVGFATVEAAALARFGNPPFGRALPIEALARIYDDYLQVVTLAGSEITQLADLAGRPVAVGTEGSSTALAAERVLLAQGLVGDAALDTQPLGTRISAQALVAGEIDAFFTAGGLPTPAVANLAAQTPVRLLSLQHLVSDLQALHGEYYQARSIPAGTYQLDAEVETVSVPTVLVVRSDLPDDTAFRLTELLFAAKPELVAAHEEARRLDHRSALATYPIELHPGAQRYYRTTKPLA